MKQAGLSFLKRLSMGQSVVFIFAIFLAIPAFLFIRSLVVCWSIMELPGMAPASCAVDNGLRGPPIDEQGIPAPTDVPPLPDTAAPEQELPAWDGGSRVTLLFIGLDERDWEVGQSAPRSDTMILFTIDPLSKTAGMLSIPRDLWVNIPGFGYNRINTAYSSGEANKLPGGGPGLAVKTVEQVIGVPVQYYAQVDFKAFEEAIDAMGGLYLCIEERIWIDPIGPKRPVKIGNECRKFWGYEVLGYVRNRKTGGGDIDRATRQQQVIMALVDQVFSPENFSTMISQAPDIYAEVESGLRTNLNLDDAIKLGVLLTQIQKKNIKHGVIDYTMAALDMVDVNGQNASILKAFPDAIRVLRDEIFSAEGPLNPMANGDPSTLMQEDAARVSVVNGTYTEDLPERIGDYLLSQGLQVVEVGDYAGRQYSRTTFVIYSPKLYTLRFLIGTFMINENDARKHIVFSPDPISPVDIEIRVGADAIGIIP
jgi:LCP family protein required for cell wall assembly